MSEIVGINILRPTEINRFILDFSSFYHLQTIIESFVLDQYFLYNNLVQKPLKL